MSYAIQDIIDARDRHRHMCGPCCDEIEVQITGNYGHALYSAKLKAGMWSVDCDIPVRLTHNMILPDDPPVVPTTKDILAAHGLLR